VLAGDVDADAPGLAAAFRGLLNISLEAAVRVDVPLHRLPADEDLRLLEAPRARDEPAHICLVVVALAMQGVRDRQIRRRRQHREGLDARLAHMGAGLAVTLHP